jgi:competence protein ComGC
MKCKLPVILLSLVVSILLALGSTGLAEEPDVVDMEGGQAKVSWVEGRAELFRKEH